MKVHLPNTWLCLFFLLAAWVTESQAQIPMTRSTFTGGYSSISIAGGATASTAIGDDVIQTGVPIGFSFTYLGVPYTTLATCSNGWVSFTATAMSAANPNLATATLPNAVLAPWWDDLTSPAIIYQTTGVPGSQVFTMQWTSLTYYFTSTRNIEYQVKLYEGTNAIEFLYGPISGNAANAYTSESASIGIENTVGGPGNYIDAVSGSSFTCNGTLNSMQWPTINYRFTPGSPAQMAGGMYNVGAGQTYTTLTEAVADINHKGIAGAVTLNLTAAASFTDKAAGGTETFPVVFGPVAGTSAVNTITLEGNAAELSYAGSTAGNWANGSATGTMFATAAEPILGVNGTDYLTVNNLKLSGISGVVIGANTGTPQRVDRGLAVQNSGAINGATNNTFTNLSITLDRTNANSLAIDQGNATVPTSALGANSNNTYKNLTIKNTIKGISLGGNATFPDIGNVIGTTACNIYNMIGDPAVPNDLGNPAGTTPAYGILVTNQSGIKVYNNNIRNITTLGGQIDGISIATFQGVPEVYNNKIQTLKNAAPASLALVSGIRASHTTTGTHTLRLYNNSVSEISSGYTGVASATRVLRGIYIAGTAGATTQVYEIYNNSVSIDGSAALNLSNACYEISTTSGPIFKLANNIFANFTAAQTGVARHFAVVSTSGTLFGNTGTTSDNNDYFVLNDVGTTGFVGLGNATSFSTLASWQAGMVGLDAVSVSVDPAFGSNTSDLHPAAVGLNGTGQVPPAYITQDLDCAPRTPDNDIGAYILNACASVAGGTITPATMTKCAAQTYTMSAVGASIPSVGLTYQWEISATGGGVGFSPVAGATSTSYTTLPLTAGVYYYRLNVTCSSGPITAYSTELVLTVNALPPVTVTPTTGLFCAPGGAPVALTSAGALTYTWTPSAGLSATTGTNVNATPSTTTTYTVSGTDINGCVNTATAAITSSPAVTITSATATPSTVCLGANSVLNAVAGIAATVDSYSFTAGTGTTLDPMVGATSIIGVSNDDTPSAPTTIGFNFTYNGTAYSQFSVSPDGWILLGGATGTSEFTNLVTSLTNVPKIYPYWDDMATGTTGFVKYLVTGSAPNRILVVEWFVTIPRNTAGAANSTFQAWLYETSNKIEFRYGTMGTATMSSSVGLTGTAAATQFNCLTLSAGTNSTTVANNTNTIQPPIGTIYTFIPPSVSSYSWSPSTFLSSTSGATVNANAITSSITYQVIAASLPGCTDTSTVAVTAGTPLGAPTFTNTPSCDNTAFTITAAVTGGGLPYTYSWVDNLGTVYPNAATINVAALAAGSYPFSVYVTDVCGGSSMQTTTIVVSPKPVPAITPPTSSICGGVPASIPLAASATTGGVAGTYTYSWFPAAGLSATNTANVNAAPTASTTYNVVATDASTGCVGTTTASVGVGPAVSATATATPTAVCTSGSSTLVAVGTTAVATYCTPTYTNGTGFGDYVSLVQIPTTTLNSTSAGAPTPYYTLFPTAGSTTATLTAGSTYTITLSAGTYTVNDLAAWIDYNGNGILNDAGEKLGETDNLGAAPATTSFTFTVPLGAYNGLARLRVRDVDHAGTNDMDPCAAQSTFGETEDYNITIVGGVDPLAYSWTPSTNLSGTTTASVTASGLTSAATYTVTASAPTGCSASANVSITVNPFPVLTITDPALACAPATADITAAAVTAGSTNVGTLSYWADMTATTPIPIASGTPSAISAAGTYYIKADNAGCTDVEAVNVTIGTSPVLTITDPATVCTPSTVDITAAAVTAGSTNVGTLSYWYNLAATTTIPPANGTAGALTLGGTYYIKADNGGCTDVEAVNVAINSASVTVPPTDGVTRIADYEITVGAWTSYYDNNGTPSNSCDDYLLLSIQKNGNNIGSVGTGVFEVKVGGAPGSTPIPYNNNYVQSSIWNVMNRHWVVTPDPQPATDVNVRFYYTTPDFNAIVASSSTVTTHEEMKFYKINGAADPDPSVNQHAGIPAAPSYNATGYWQYNNGAASTSTWAYAVYGANHYAEYTVGSFSGGGGGGGAAGGAFPIELLSFNGHNEGAQNILDWTTMNEINFSHFQVLRSSDKVAFEELGQVQGKGANPTASYSFVDAQPLRGVNYYKLNMVDIDGTSKYSNTIELLLGDKISFSLYPNPTKDKVTVSYSGETSTAYFELYDVLGQLVVRHKLNNNEKADIELSSYAKGVYTYQIKSGVDIHLGKLVKE